MDMEMLNSIFATPAGQNSGFCDIGQVAQNSAIGVPAHLDCAKNG